MIHVLVDLHVENVDGFWEEFQTRLHSLREVHGSLGAEVFHDRAMRNRVTILFRWESRVQFEQFMARWTGDAMRDAPGEQRLATVRFLHKMGELDA